MPSRVGTSWAFTRAVGWLPDRLLRNLYYQYKFNRLPDLRAPNHFTELIQQRMLEDRSDQVAWTCDKLRMKEFALANTSAARVPDTYWSGVNVRHLGDVDLPADWVLKPNHRSQTVFLGEGHPDLDHLADLTKGWLRMYERAYLGEWAYRKARRCLMAEERLGDHCVINDYKFYVFGGVPRLIHVDTDRFSNHKRRFYTTDWQPLEYRNVYPLAPVQPPPKCLDKMLTAAADLGRAFDFIRVDLYDVDGEVYFGELTPYPGGGMEPFTPQSVDRELGDFWKQAAASKTKQSTVAPVRLALLEPDSAHRPTAKTAP